MAFSVTGKNESNQTCFQFTAKEVEDITIVKVTTALTAFLACCIVIVIIVAFREYRQFVHRLVLYLMIAGTFTSLAHALEVAPVYHNGSVVAVRNGLDGLCAAVGFLIQITLWMFFCVILWIVIYLFFFAVFKYRANTKKQEIAGVVFTLVFPFTFNWIPFIHNMYGLAGAWCWIKLTKEDCTDNLTLGLTYQIVLLYGPRGLLIPFTIVCFTVIIIVLCKQNNARGDSSRPSVHQQAVKEALSLLVYPLIFNIIFSFKIANRIYYAVKDSKEQHPYYPLWMAHAVLDVAAVLIPPFAFMLHPNTIRKLLCRTQHSTTDANTEHVVPPEFQSEADPLIIRRSEESCNYQGIFEGSA